MDIIGSDIFHLKVVSRCIEMTLRKAGPDSRENSARTKAKISSSEVKVSVLSGVWEASKEGSSRAESSEDLVFRGYHRENIGALRWDASIEHPGRTIGCRSLDLQEPEPLDSSSFALLLGQMANYAGLIL